MPLPDVPPTTGSLDVALFAGMAEAAGRRRVTLAWSGGTVADLRRRLVEEGVKEAPLRVEFVLAHEPSEVDVEWRTPLLQAGVSIEGRIGSVVTVTLPTGAKAMELAAHDQVVSVRLPRPARVVLTDVQAEPKKEQPKKDEPKKDLSRAGFGSAGFAAVGFGAGVLAFGLAAAGFASAAAATSGCRSCRIFSSPPSPSS